MVPCRAELGSSSVEASCGATVWGGTNRSGVHRLDRNSHSNGGCKLNRGKGVEHKIMAENYREKTIDNKSRIYY